MIRTLLACLVLVAFSGSLALAQDREPTSYPANWRGDVTGAGELDKCRFTEDHKELFLDSVQGYLDPWTYTSADISVMTVADYEALLQERWREAGVDFSDPEVYANPAIYQVELDSRFETFDCRNWTEGKDWDIVVVEIKKSGTSGESKGNQFELGAEQNEVLPDPPKPPFDGTPGTPESDRSGNPQITGTVTGNRTGSGQTARQIPVQSQGAPPTGCGRPDEDLARLFEATKRTLEDFGYGAFSNYEEVVGTFAPAVEDLLVIDPNKPRVLESMAWRAPGTKTILDNGQFGCFQAAIAQDLRWLTGQPYYARPRTLELPGGISLETAGGAGPGGEAAVLQRIYGGQNHILKYQTKGILGFDQIRQPGWILVTKRQLEVLIAEYGERGGHPRGLVIISYDYSPVSHAINVRWNGAGQVELWDASEGRYADLSGVNQYWFFPTN
ncbi:MAG: hypothetical protein AAF495_05930 [Pseudomonadota bacterium]